MVDKSIDEQITYQIKKLNKEKNNFLDYKMFDLCMEYMMQGEPNIELCRENFKLFKYFKNVKISNLSWSNICEIAKVCNIRLNKFNQFIIYLNEKGCLNFHISETLIQYMKSVRNISSIKTLYSTDISNIYAYYCLPNSINIVFIKTNNFVRDLIIEFILESPHVRGTASVRNFYEEFENSFSDISIAKSLSCIEDFSYDTFKQQFLYFLEMGNKNLLRILVNFYLFLSSKYTGLFKPTDGVDIYILQKPNFINEYIGGARKVLLNPFQEVPKHDIWFLDFNNLNYSSNKYSEEVRKVIDFTVIKNDLYRKLAKEYFWNSPDSIVVKLQRYHYIKPFFNYISDLKCGEEMSIYVKRSKSIDYTFIGMNEIMAYKTFTENKETSDNSFNTSILSAKHVLEYLSQNNLIQLEQGVLYYLKSKQVRYNNDAKPIPDNELLKLAKLMKIKADTSYEDMINYLIFYIALETEFRISHILNLKIDCVEEASKPGEYVIKSIDKTSDGNLLEHSITTYTKKHIDYLIKVTQEIRSNCKNPNLRKYLFLSKSNRNNIITKHSERQFNTFVKNCCNELGLPKYTASNIRDTHITKAQEFILRNNKSDIEQSILTGHRDPDSDKYYIEANIIDMLETVYMTTIGEVDIKGQIVDTLPPDIANPEHSVSNNCGYCGSNTCNEYSYLDCLMCKSFIATVDRISYFEEQIAVIDNKIQHVNIKHDKEDLVNIKQLLLNYLKRLLVRKESFNQ